MTETENKTLIILCCCFYPTNNGSTSYSDTRKKQYIDGLNKLFEYSNYFVSNNIDICLIDNSIRDGTRLPEDILTILPKNIKLILHSNNKYGGRNKGCGLIENWLYMKETIEKYKWIIHFEPRQQLKNNSLIENFISNKRNLFTMGKEMNHFNTGLFCIESSTLLKYIETSDLNGMCTKYISIEYHIYNFFIREKISYDLQEKMELLWYDGNLLREM